MAQVGTPVFCLVPVGNQSPNPLTAVLRSTREPASSDRKGGSVSLLWIILIVILVLALLGFFTRGRW
jgi:ABC-type polysaccharide/polyol phosphate export permease